MTDSPSKRVVLRTTDSSSVSAVQVRLTLPSSAAFLRADALPAGSSRAAKAIADVPALPSSGFDLSDLLIARELRASSTPVSRWNDFDIAPLGGGAIASGQPIDVLWEIYGLSEAAGQARYRITLVVEQLAENGAIADLNFVRTNAGGLPALASDFAGDLVTEMLYERRYSLFFEYGHRWVDARRYGRLGDLRKQLPTHRVFPLVPIPVDECNQRLAAPPRGCVNVLGQ